VDVFVFVLFLAQAAVLLLMLQKWEVTLVFN